MSQSNLQNRSATAGSRRTTNTDACLEETLAHIRDEDLADDVEVFHRTCLPKVDQERLLRAAKVAKNPKTYQDISKGIRNTQEGDGLVRLTEDEKEALRNEQGSFFSEPGMLIVIFTVSLAAFLQGHVQSSINGASLYHEELGLCPQFFEGKQACERAASFDVTHPGRPRRSDWALGATNAAPFLASALLGCWLALPVSDRYGRKGSMAVAAVLVLATSLLSALVPTMASPKHRWPILLGVRIVNGVGMGIKAVNTPILASETAIGYWRGTSILAWQLWVAFGIFIGFVFNTIFALTSNRESSLGLILGAPILPSVLLLLALLICPESPRWYMRRGPRYSPEESYKILKRLRKEELIAMRDVYLLHKSIQHEHGTEHDTSEFVKSMRRDGYIGTREFISQYVQLSHRTRLRNALISSSIVALAQQLCGINILAFYSGSLFSTIFQSNNLNDSNHATVVGMYFSMGFGAINFLFGIPAFRTIDTIGRRKWLLVTLIPMALSMAAAALSFLIPNADWHSARTISALVAVFLYIHTALYSPGLGPVPFTLAAESFPLSHREVGCAFAVSVNLFFAGILSICFPSMASGLSSPGVLGLFSGFNVLAFILVFLLVEETRHISLEDLDFLYAVPKAKFIRYNALEYLPWIFKDYIPYLLSCCVQRGRVQAGDPEASETLSTELKVIVRPPPRLYTVVRSEDKLAGHESELRQTKLSPDDPRS